MSSKEERERGREGTPPRLPEITPPVFPGRSFDFTLQGIFEMQKTLGELTQAIKTLTEESKESRKTLSRLSHIIYAAGAVITVLGVIGGWVLGKVWELLVPILQTHKP